MKQKIEMSMMGKLNYFLELHIKWTLTETLIHQQKYVEELLKRFKMEESEDIDTPIATATKLDADEICPLVEQKLYEGISGSLLYLIASRPDIDFSVGLCARCQVNSKLSHLKAVKRILKYLKGTTDFGLWYSKGSNFNLVG